MVQNYDIKTDSKYLESAYVTIGGVVPTGMKRYVTFLQVTPVRSGGSEGSKVYICSTPASDTASSTGAASANQKMVVGIGSGTAVGAATIPTKPETEHPLFTIAAEQFLSAYIGTAAGFSSPVQIFAQYYDE